MITPVNADKIGARADWMDAQAQLLAREKECTRLGDELAQSEQ